MLERKQQDPAKLKSEITNAKCKMKKETNGSIWPSFCIFHFAFCIAFSELSFPREKTPPMFWRGFLF